MVHGDSIDDEWLAVWILREATKIFPELVVSVRDSDGEFLLAEAALHIPHWITPENSQNRAEDAAFTRLGGYPGAIMHNGQDDAALVDFLEDLKQVGYFDETKQASELIDKRRRLHAMQHAGESGHSAGLLVREAAQILERAVAEYSASGADLSDRPDVETPAADAVDDDDSWLTVRPEELDSLMRKAESVLKDATQDEDADNVPGTGSGSSGHGSTTRNIVDESGNGLQGVLGNLEAFLETNSGIEGAVTLDDISDDEYDENSDEDIDMDADGILGALMEAIGIGGLSELDRAYQQHNDQVRSTDAKTEREIIRETEQSVDAMSQIMDAMDHELSATNIGKSFVRNERGDSADDEDSNEDDDDMPDVNVDLNLIENIVQSFKAQEGLPGPAGTMLSQFGIHLPPNGSGSNSGDGA
ncbi:hypothetical protein GGI15_000514 [Coemansia interrupta]|uniref:Uncharacterized protein n=1 Tax=Coemansia interrupta TaxID=1126814 RepID=A0A9W8HPJ0_9FUNG|nr:hypothetical protein GGI15_000514 [Coemansia interrupta]